jgi:hypothetical protein
MSVKIPKSHSVLQEPFSIAFSDVKKKFLLTSQKKEK